MTAPLNLLRQVIAHARTNGWHHDTTDLSGLPRDHRWRRDGAEVNWFNACLYINNTKFRPVSVRQAVNLLVDLDVLPATLHSAYAEAQEEIDGLGTEVVERDAELTELDAKIADLTAEVERLRAQLADRGDPETGAPLPRGVEGHHLGHRGEDTGCPSVHRDHGRCYDIAGHAGDHHRDADEDGDPDPTWTDEQAAAVAREMENPTPKCLCGEVFDTQEALDAHVAARGVYELTTEEPDRTLTAPERDTEARIAQVEAYAGRAMWPGPSADDPNDEITDTEWVSDAIDAKAVEL